MQLKQSHLDQFFVYFQEMWERSCEKHEVRVSSYVYTQLLSQGQLDTFLSNAGFDITKEHNVIHDKPEEFIITQESNKKIREHPEFIFYKDINIAERHVKREFITSKSLNIKYELKFSYYNDDEQINHYFNDEQINHYFNYIKRDLHHKLIDNGFIKGQILNIYVRYNTDDIILNVSQIVVNKKHIKTYDIEGYTPKFLPIPSSEFATPKNYIENILKYIKIKNQDEIIKNCHEEWACKQLPEKCPENPSILINRNIVDEVLKQMS